MSDKQLGMRIKRLREANDITLDDLAQRTGLDRDFLASLEKDCVYPPLGPLIKVARALGVRLGTFLDDEMGHDPLLVRLGEREEGLSMLDGGHCGGEMKFYSLGKGKIDRHMEPFFVQLMPTTCQERPLSSHEGEEFIVVHEGSIEVVYGAETATLDQGDSIYLNSIVPHHVGCRGAAPASIYAILYFPE